MAEIFNTTFLGSGLPAGLITDHRLDATSVVALGNLTLSSTATADNIAIVRQSGSVAIADNDTATFHVSSSTPFGLSLSLRTTAGDIAFHPAVSVTSGGNYYTAYYRIATGFGGLRQTGPTFGASPYVRFRRSGSNMVVETATNYTGSYTLLDTFDEVDGLWTATWSTGQIEMATFGTSNTVVIAGLGNESDVSAPTISNINPTTGSIGTQVTITGTNLTGSTVVTHGPSVSMSGLIIDSDTQIRATIPSNSPASGTIRVTTPAGTAVGPLFTIIPIYSGLEITNPNTSYITGSFLDTITIRAIDQFSASFLGNIPSSGSVPANSCSISILSIPANTFLTGTLVVPFVSGVATFSDLKLLGSIITAVKVNGINVSSYTVDSPTQITAVLASNTTTGRVTVEAAGGSATSSTDYTSVYPYTNFQYVSGTYSITPPVGVVITPPIEIEAWNSGTLTRDTLYTGTITFGTTLPSPNGYTIVSGTLTRTAVSGVASFNDIQYSSASSPISSGSLRRSGSIFGSLFSQQYRI